MAMRTPFKYHATIRGVEYGADTLQLLSQIYCLARDVSGEGCSTFRPINVTTDGKEIGHISYNGRVWEGPTSPSGLWIPPCCDTITLIYDNREQAS
jgi:hypothetical protein